MSSAVTQALRRKISQHVYWTDSSVVLSWIRSGSSINLKAFVANRVAAVRKLSDTDTWRHVPTKYNPADLSSRGVNPKEIAACELWWKGPKYLSLPMSEWPSIQPQSNIDIKNLPEVRSYANINSTRNSNVSTIIKFNNYSKLKRLQYILGYIYRCINNCRNSKTKTNGSLTVTELDKALHSLVYISQLE